MRLLYLRGTEAPLTSSSRKEGRRMTMKRIISKLERQQRDLNEIVDALRQINLDEHKVDGAESLEECEKRLIAKALMRAGGNQAAAARILRVSRDRLRYKIAKHGLHK